MSGTMAAFSHYPGEQAGTGGFLDPVSVVDSFELKEGMAIADFGCGAGYFTILLAERVGSSGKIYALDVQEYALDNVRAKAKINGLSNIETIRANLEVLGSSGLPNESQDLVLLANILFQSSKKTEIIREAKRVLKTGGRLIVIDWEKGNGKFGPPDDSKMNSLGMSDLIQKDGLSFQRKIWAGQFHFGFIFKK